MKHIRLLVATAAFAAASLSSFAVTVQFGPVIVKLTSIQQNTNRTIFSTNTTSTTTNLTFTTVYTTETTKINDSELLTMLANSLTMTWPAGATLKLDSFGDFDVVVNGTNIVEDVSEVLHMVAPGTNTMFSGTVVDKETITSGGGSETETDKLTETSSASLVYDDSFLPTVNGTNTQITMTGIETAHVIETASNSGETFKSVFTFTGTGAGIIFSSSTTNQVIIAGSLAATEL
jgi:hypothetical protein